MAILFKINGTYLIVIGPAAGLAGVVAGHAGVVSVGLSLEVTFRRAGLDATTVQLHVRLLAGRTPIESVLLQAVVHRVGLVCCGQRRQNPGDVTGVLFRHFRSGVVQIDDRRNGGQRADRRWNVFRRLRRRGRWRSGRHLRRNDFVFGRRLWSSFGSEECDAPLFEFDDRPTVVPDL